MAKGNDMKILCINAMGPTAANPQGGIFVSYRIKALKKMGIWVDAINFGFSYKGIAKHLVKKNGISTLSDLKIEQIGVQYRTKLVYFGILDLLLGRICLKSYMYKIYRHMLREIQTMERVDLIHIHWVWLAGLGMLRLKNKKNIPYVVTCHGSDVNVNLNNKRAKKYILEILESADAVEFVSRALLENAMKAGYSGRNAHVIYNGIDTDVFFDRRINKEKAVVGFVGNLVRVKGADRLPKIFSRIYNEYGDAVEFIVVGQGEMETSLKREMADLPVTFTGQISSEELALQYAHMSVLIVPSRSEGYSCVIKEAQACGVVPVANDVGGISEALGEYGFLVSEKDEILLCDKLAEKALAYLSGEITVDLSQMERNAGLCTWQNRQTESLVLYKSICDRK